MDNVFLIKHKSSDGHKIGHYSKNICLVSTGKCNMIGNDVRMTLAAVTNSDSVIFAGVVDVHGGTYAAIIRIWETAHLPLP